MHLSAQNSAGASTSLVAPESAEELLVELPLLECNVDSDNVSGVFETVELVDVLLLLPLIETVASTELTPITMAGVLEMPELDLRLESGGVSGPPGDIRSPASADVVWAAGVHCCFFSASAAAIFLFVLIAWAILASRFFRASSCGHDRVCG